MKRKRIKYPEESSSLSSSAGSDSLFLPSSSSDKPDPSRDRALFLTLLVSDGFKLRPPSDVEAGVYVQALSEINNNILRLMKQKKLNIYDADFSDASKSQFLLACANKFTFDYLVSMGSFSHFRISVE
eukprot:TRINITY_DN4112_c0_g1_i1.p1 TRINITY_DN4112_c0_g1~~TRINITY_DN4112_c0_g1_i1.p1  ORF type:complete len:128 (-),score=38.52 TRINITY_DN4112_c0_g1_i1:133-516(-)